MWVAFAALAAAQAQPADSIRYPIRPGDTLSQLAGRYLARGRGWRDLKRLWRVADPHRLPAGRTFQIPRTWLRWTPQAAEIASVRGSVTVRVGGRAAVPARGLVLGEGDEIDTAANSFTTLALPNGSRIALPSQSHVTILRLRRYALDEAINYRFGLNRGRVDSDDAPLLSPYSEFGIETPLSMTAVRGTQYAVSYDPASGLAGTAVFEGAVAVSGRGGEHPQLLAAQFGAVTDRGGGSQAIALAAAPALVDPGRVQADDVVTFDLTPVAGASAYRAQLASDAGFVDSYDERSSPVPHFEFANVPNGRQFVRISAVREGGLAGMRQSYSFRRQLASIRAEVERTPRGLLFKWFGEGAGTRHYHLRIFRDAPQGTPVVDEVGLTRTEATLRRLPKGVYFWSVVVSQAAADGPVENWTPPEKLTIADGD